MTTMIGLVRGFLCLALIWPALAEGQALPGGSPVALRGLQAPAVVTRDANGIAHIEAQQEHDLYFLQGYVHAEDRLFQMDVSRRQASGTLAELLGPKALPSDVQLRTLGLRRAAVRSLPLLSPRVQAALEAYAAGVNAFVASHPLPLEYRLLELSQFAPWTALDGVVVGKLVAFALSFDLDIDRTVALGTYQQAGVLRGFDGNKLFFEDLFRSAPFDPASTVPDASVPGLAVGPAQSALATVDPRVVQLGQRFLERVKDVALFEAIRGREPRGGSNEWALSGAHTVSGFPLVANDPHLALDVPSTFYPIHLRAGQMNVTGHGFAGSPFVVLGHNAFIAWGVTFNPLDVTDTYLEQVVPDPASPSGLSTVHLGAREPIIPIPEVFRRNNLGNGILDDLVVVPPPAVPPVTLIVPRRNQGPIIELDLTTGTALSVQYTGFSGTRELDAILAWNEARTLDDFQRGVPSFDVGSLNLVYGDVAGNIAYSTTAEMPLREDLESGVVTGLPPFFIRDGRGGNEWMPVKKPLAGQAIPYRILPPDEMPHLVNPRAGFFVNANNDPVGTTLDNDPLNQLRPGGGIYYLNPVYDGIRGGRITRMIREKLAGGGKASFADIQRMQADTRMLDAQFFVPYITQAFARAKQPRAHPALAALAADPRVAEAAGRLGRWDSSTPTGIQEGYDEADTGGTLAPPSNAEIGGSVAATIYAVWRARFIAATIDRTLERVCLPLPDGTCAPPPGPDGQRALSALRNLLEQFTLRGGRGASGLDFFAVPDVSDAADRRDVVILRSLADALDRLAGPDFKPAFDNSAIQDDYRWGKLHRLVLDHLLGGPFSIPPAGGAFPHPLGPGLPGIPTDGGFGTVDRAEHDARGKGANGFMFGRGPVTRFVAEGRLDRVRAEASLPGGTSGVLGSPNYANLLRGWLANEAYALLFDAGEVTGSVTSFVPAP